MNSYEESEASSGIPRPSTTTIGQTTATTLTSIICSSVMENRSISVLRQNTDEAHSFYNEIDRIQFSPDLTAAVIHPANKENYSVYMDLTNVIEETNDRSKPKPFSENNMQISVTGSQNHDSQISTSSCLDISDTPRMSLDGQRTQSGGGMDLTANNETAVPPAICISSELSDLMDFTLPNGLKCELASHTSDRTVCGEHSMDLSGMAMQKQCAIQKQKRKSIYNESRLDITVAVPVRSENFCVTLFDETCLQDNASSHIGAASYRQADKQPEAQPMGPIDKNTVNHADDTEKLDDQMALINTPWKNLANTLMESSSSDIECCSIDDDQMFDQFQKTIDSNRKCPKDGCIETRAELVPVHQKRPLDDKETEHISDIVDTVHEATGSRMTNSNNVSVCPTENRFHSKNRETLQNAAVASIMANVKRIKIEPKSLTLTMSETNVVEYVPDQQLSTIVDELSSTSMIEDTKFDCQFMLNETPTENIPEDCVGSETSQLIRNRFSVSTILSCTQMQRQRITAIDLQMNWSNCDKFRNMATKRNALKYFRRKWLQTEETLAVEQIMAQLNNQNLAAPSLKFLFQNKWKNEEPT